MPGRHGWPVFVCKVSPEAPPVRAADLSQEAASSAVARRLLLERSGRSEDSPEATSSDSSHMFGKSTDKVRSEIN